VEGEHILGGDSGVEGACDRNLEGRDSAREEDAPLAMNQRTPEDGDLAEEADNTLEPQEEGSDGVVPGEDMVVGDQKLPDDTARRSRMEEGLGHEAVLLPLNASFELAEEQLR
jgi:hypothetical protein